MNRGCPHNRTLRNARPIRRSSMMAGIVALSCGLVGCSSESAESPSIDSSGGAATAGVASMTGSAGSTAGGTLSASGATAVVNDAGTSSSGSAASGAGSVQALGGVGGMGSAGAAAGEGCADGAILCEDFEQYPAASAPAGNWTAQQRGNGKLVVDTT